MYEREEKNTVEEPTKLMVLASRADSSDLFKNRSERLNTYLQMVLEEGRRNPHLVNTQDAEGRTALHYASQGVLFEGYIPQNRTEGTEVMIAHLMHLGGDPSIRDQAGQTVADYVLEHCYHVEERRLAIAYLSGDQAAATKIVEEYENTRRIKLEEAAQNEEQRKTEVEEERRRIEIGNERARAVAPGIKKEYEGLPSLITPPSSFTPIFEDPQQSPESYENLQLSLSYICATEKEALWDGNIQLFSIPNTSHDCYTYCMAGYTNNLAEESKADKDNLFGLGEAAGWIKLEDPTDFSCKPGFEKVFVYENGHYARQWGEDGSVLSKHGMTRYGATPVYRTNSPAHPFITKTYGEVKEVWIRKSATPIPAPFFREQSVWIHAETEDTEPQYIKSKEDLRRAIQEAQREAYFAIPLARSVFLEENTAQRKNLKHLEANNLDDSDDPDTPGAFETTGCSYGYQF